MSVKVFVRYRLTHLSVPDDGVAPHERSLLSGFVDDLGNQSERGSRRRKDRLLTVSMPAKL